MQSTRSIRQALFFEDQGQLLVQVKSLPAIWYRLSSYADGLQVFEETPDGPCFLSDSPNIRLAGVTHPSSYTRAIQSFLHNVPDAPLQAVSPFVWRQLTMLRLLCLEPAGMEIMQSCPLLIWLVADQVNDQFCSLDQAAALLRQKREQILQTILGQCSKTLVRLLAKLQPGKYDYQEIRLVYQVLRQAQTLTALRHCQTIQVPLLPVVIENPELADLPLVRELLEHPETTVFCLKRVQMLLAGCRKLACNREVPDFWMRLSRCRSLRELESFHRQLTNRFNTRLLRYRVRLEEENQALATLNERIQQRVQAFPNQVVLDDQQAREERIRRQQARQDPVQLGPEARIEPDPAPQRGQQGAQPKKPHVQTEPESFPPPPIQGTEFIKPILKPGGLKYEAKREVMDNCVGSRFYVRDTLRGVSYIYRVYKPERCTLEIRKNQDGTWRIAQLKTRSNGSPSSATKRYEESWLEEGNKKNYR